MPRPKKAAPNRTNGTYEYKATIGKTLDGKAVRKSFYSPISLEDAKRKAEEYKVKQAVIDTVGVTAETASDTNFTAHELRHTRGTQLRRNGVDIYTIQKLLDHKDINVTAQVYVHDDLETTRMAAKIL